MQRANDHLLYLSGVISESAYLDRVLHETISESVTSLQAKNLLLQLSKRIGEKRMNAYAPILNTIKNNKNLLEVFTRLLTTLASSNPSQMQSKFGDKFMNQNTSNAVRAGGRKLSNKFEDPDLALLTNFFANKRPELREMFESLVHELMNAKTSDVRNVVDRFNTPAEPVASENVNDMRYDPESATTYKHEEHPYGVHKSQSYDRYKRNRSILTDDHMSQEYQKYIRAINDVHAFIEKMSAVRGSDVYIKIFDRFINDLRANGMIGA